jgi:hypothetical protein
MGDGLYDDPGLLKPEIARRFAATWDAYWLVRELSRSELAESSYETTTRATELLGFGLRFLKGDGTDDDMSLQAVILMMNLADELLFLDDAAASEKAWTSYPAVFPFRRQVEMLLYKTGVADWCARLGWPLVDADGNQLGFRIGPLPPKLTFDAVRFIALEYGPPGAERAAAEARVDFGETVADALHAYRAMRKRIQVDAALDDGYRTHLRAIGIETLRNVRVAGNPILRSYALGQSPTNVSLPSFAERWVMLTFVGRCLRLAADSYDREYLDACAVVNDDDMAMFDDPGPPDGLMTGP